MCICVYVCMHVDIIPGALRTRLLAQHPDMLQPASCHVRSSHISRRTARAAYGARISHRQRKARVDTRWIRQNEVGLV
jgi:hypothetical protein